MSPKSPLKRALSSTSDSGNSQPSSSSASSTGQENRRSGSISPTVRKSLEKHRNLPFDIEVTPPVNFALSRLGDGRSDCGGAAVTTSSPLKRNDAIMNLDQASLGSPVAKRRSLHGSASFGHDFNVFDHGPTSSPFEIHDDSTQEYQLSASSISAGNSIGPALIALPRRSSSLRKSTLQQRHGDKSSWGRRHAAQESSSSSTDMATPVTYKNRPRLSLDQYMPPMSRDSPFTGQGSLPNASVHVLNQSHHTNHQPHPLSRTMTTSSSSSSLADDSPTHLPVHFGDQQRPKLDFSKSMPVVALRPFALEAAAREHSFSESVATPDNYKSVKPLPAAFMSTGLISKVNRNPEEPQLPRGVTKGHMPDTPCKKPANGFPTMPPPVPGSAIAKARHIRHSFGTPSTPFNPHNNQPSQGTFGKGISNFGSGFGDKSLTRRGSFLSLDGYDNGESPENKSDSQLSNDYDLPPTPTKQALTPNTSEYNLQQVHRSPHGLRSVPVSTSAVGYVLSQKFPRMSSKLKLLTTRDDPDADESDVSMDLNDSSPTADFRLSPNTSFSMPSFSRSRARRGLNVYSPAPLIPVSLTSSFVSPSRKPGFAKLSHVAPASPLERIDFIERISPRTPQESMLPPNPSSSSIYNRRDGHLPKQSLSGTAAMPPPATPTTGRDYFTTFGNHRKSVTPINDFVAAQVDEALTSRFDKVELIGTGEFSQVYRVTQPMQSLTATQSFYFGTPGSPLHGRTPPTPMPDRVFAVKKSRQPYQGTRDRQQKLQEVNVLRALGHSDHVVHLIDSWEAKDYLYIQTEFCEEGSLDLFLSQVGRKGRLDDFRIWKILLELGQVSLESAS
jgi:mitosis inhibitor protein kinase SWE1